MKEVNVYKDIVNKWGKDFKGVGSIHIAKPLKIFPIIHEVLSRLYNKTPSGKVLILLDDIKRRGALINYLIEEPNEYNVDFDSLINTKKISIWTEDYSKKVDFTRAFYQCVIYYGINEFRDTMKKVFAVSKFKLVCMNGYSEDNEKRVELYKYCPLVENISNLVTNVSTPVEEIRIPITIEDEDELKKLTNYNNYITDSIAIFGTFDTMSKCRHGDANLNKSNIQICDEIARENGWNENLDMSIELYRKIDSIFNPNLLYERASITYDIIRKRSELLASNKAKLDAIVNICKNNPNKKILIINKQATFASEVADRISRYIENTTFKNVSRPQGYMAVDSCLACHPKLETVDMLDNYGNPICYKSGDKEGMPKTMGAQAQCTSAKRMFGEDWCNILSVHNAPDKDIYGDVDIMIITSPSCDTIDEYLFRLSDINFKSNPKQIYKLFIEKSNEEQGLEKEKISDTHIVKTIANKCENIKESMGIVIID